MFCRKAKLKARAKVNLTLEVKGRLPTGLHLLHSLICPISLADEISLELQDPAEGVQIKCSFSPELEQHLHYSARRSPKISEIIENLQTGNNLAVCAANQFLDYWHLRDEVGVSINLLKNIPFEAGLGGGSADAAAVIRGLACLTDRPEKGADSEAIAGALGADVPAQLVGELVFAHGTGRDLIRLRGDKEMIWPPAYRDLGIVVVKPLSGVSTAQAYADLGFEPGSGVTDAAERDAISSLLRRFGLRILARDILDQENEKKLTLFQQEGSSDTPGFPLSTASLPCCFVNDFERVVVKQNAEVGAVFNLLKAAGAAKVLLAGSGSSVLGFTHSHQEALELVRFVRQRADEGWFITATELETSDVSAQLL